MQVQLCPPKLHGQTKCIGKEGGRQLLVTKKERLSIGKGWFYFYVCCIICISKGKRLPAAMVGQILITVAKN